MKKIIIGLIFLMTGSFLNAQEKAFKAIDSAYYYYVKKDLKKAAYFYDLYYLVQKNTQSNYDTYRAAVASSYIGNMENAKYYIKRSGEIFYDYSGFYEFPSYDTFVNDTIHRYLRNLPEWKNFITVLKYKADSAQISIDKITMALKDTSNRANQSVLSNTDYWNTVAKKESTASLIQKIKNFKAFKPVKKTDFWTMYYIKVNDTLTVPFLVYIPKNYQPVKKTPLYVYLHGAIVGRTNFSNPAWIEKGREVKIMDKAKSQNAFIIYPFGKKSFGWIYQQQAFETILREIEMIKSIYNIDDNKVYIGGHSNGGSGAFWYAVNKPTTFASFLGLNYLPKVYASNTSLRNLKNSPTFYGISGSEDATFPLPVVDGIYKLGIENGANWKNFVKQGGHGLPIDSKDSISFIFDTLITKTRNPFPKNIQWETDNIRNGRNAWLEIIELDTLAEKASWHTLLNPTVTQNGKAGILDFSKNKSGAIIASVQGNTIDIQTSRVKRIKIYISTDMFDLSHQIKLIINGKDFINMKLDADKNVILEEFLKTKDRDFIVANKIELAVK
ncbi:alpha/beta hydrolase-fold protein [Pedobacter frigiditerrae]|nr:alpha/beta hydrolase-fold protein [Pedobacter frigiditerrae]